MIFWNKFKDSFEPEDEESQTEEGGSENQNKDNAATPSGQAAKPIANQVDAKSQTSADKEIVQSASSTKKAEEKRAGLKKEEAFISGDVYHQEVSGLHDEGIQDITINEEGILDEGSEDSKGLKSKIQGWYKDSYESVVVQRNLLLLITIISIITIAISVMVIRFVNNAQTIEPFVIEINEKTGIPTVVEPVSAKVYTADEAIQRYFVMQYIKAREEYFPSTYEDNYYNVVRVFSDPNIYYNDYRPKFSTANPNSPYNLYRQSIYRTVVLRSYTPKGDNTALVRISLELGGAISQSVKQDKVVLIGYEFQNIEMNSVERLINPLGFRVTFYRIEDEKI